MPLDNTFLLWELIEHLQINQMYIIFAIYLKKNDNIYTGQNQTMAW